MLESLQSEENSFATMGLGIYNCYPSQILELLEKIISMSLIIYKFRLGTAHPAILLLL
ncbi:hypothetical protein [Methylacidiphilum caldifontis]|uniref:hypothetical protein n=1 Tax=Methylacidiphilum caldifontis TaxID=2795386 RepID=UPI0036F424B4